MQQKQRTQRRRRPTLKYQPRRSARRTSELLLPLPLHRAMPQRRWSSRMQQWQCSQRRCQQSPKCQPRRSARRTSKLQLLLLALATLLLLHLAVHWHSSSPSRRGRRKRGNSRMNSSRSRRMRRAVAARLCSRRPGSAASGPLGAKPPQMLATRTKRPTCGGAKTASAAMSRAGSSQRKSG